MRTTVTLDPDVERLLHEAMQQQGSSFKETLNCALRAGLAGGTRDAKQKFVQKTFSMGSEQYFRWDKALAMADALEDEEIVRKLAVRK